MNKTWTSTFLFKIAFGVFVVLLTLINYQALASEKEQNSEFSNPFLPLYPNDSDYQAFNQEIAQRMGIDLDNSCPLKIAVIDSGIDAGADGLQGKIDIYRNYTADGAVKLQKVSKSLGAGLYLDNRRYGLPKTAEAAKYYCGIYDSGRYGGAAGAAVTENMRKDERRGKTRGGFCRASCLFCKIYDIL